MYYFQRAAVVTQINCRRKALVSENRSVCLDPRAGAVVPAPRNAVRKENAATGRTKPACLLTQIHGPSRPYYTSDLEPMQSGP
jgi:hypothetical protein